MCLPTRCLWLYVALLAASRFAVAADFCIAGSVVNALTGEPLSHAAVTTPQSASMTDASGAFRFCGLPAGSYFTNSEKPGFVAGGLRVTVGPSREDVLLRLQPLAVVKGKVSDTAGDPLENALIQLLSVSAREGRRKVHLESATTTDDRGQYRLPNLPPGRYLLRAAGWQGPGSATKQPDASQTFAPVYYGGVTELSAAAPLTAEAGREVTADFSVTMDASYKIHGSISGFSASLPITIELLGPEGDLTAAPVSFNATAGTFQVDSVAPGRYILRATQGQADERLRGEQELQVGAADVNDVVLTLAAAVTLKGTVRIAGSSPTDPPPPSCSVDLSPAEAALSGEAVPESSTGEEGEFEISGLLPGRYRLRMECPNGYIAAAHAAESDLLARDELLISPGAPPPPLEVILGTDGAALEVTAAAQKDADPVTAWFVLVPDSGNDLRTRFAILRGKVTISGLAPGDYQAYAWTGSPYAFEYASPEARQSWADRSVSVHVTEHDRQSVTIKVAAADSP